MNNGEMVSWTKSDVTLPLGLDKMNLSCLWPGMYGSLQKMFFFKQYTKTIFYKNKNKKSV